MVREEEEEEDDEVDAAAVMASPRHAATPITAECRPAALNRPAACACKRSIERGGNEVVVGDDDAVASPPALGRVVEEEEEEEESEAKRGRMQASAQGKSGGCGSARHKVRQ